MGVDGITVSPGYAYERAPDQQHFLNRDKTKQLFRDIFKRGKAARNGRSASPSLFLDFLAGNQTYHCTPWGNPTRTVFGWQKPCYLLGEGYTKTFEELMEEHRLGRLRHRQLREVRRLHGAFRLRGDRRQRCRSRIRSRLWPLACAACAPRAQWPPKSRSTGSGRRNTSFHSMSSTSSRKSGNTKKRHERPKLVAANCIGNWNLPAQWPVMFERAFDGAAEFGNARARGTHSVLAMLSAVADAVTCRRSAVFATRRHRRQLPPVARRCSATSAMFPSSSRRHGAAAEAARRRRPQAPAKCAARAGTRPAGLAERLRGRSRLYRSGPMTMTPASQDRGFDVIAGHHHRAFRRAADIGSRRHHRRRGWK